jgi:hypothetical protein
MERGVAGFFFLFILYARTRVEKWGSLADGARVGRNLGPKLSSLLRDGASDSRALHFTLRVDNHTSIVLKVDENTIASPPRLALTNDDSCVDWKEK